MYWVVNSHKPEGTAKWTATNTHMTNASIQMNQANQVITHVMSILIHEL